MSIVEIENAIKELPPEKVNELMEWFVKYHSEIWDKQSQRIWTPAAWIQYLRR